MALPVITLPRTINGVQLNQFILRADPGLEMSVWNSTSVSLKETFNGNVLVLWYWHPAFAATTATNDLLATGVYDFSDPAHDGTSHGDLLQSGFQMANIGFVPRPRGGTYPDIGACEVNVSSPDCTTTVYRNSDIVGESMTNAPAMTTNIGHASDLSWDDIPTEAKWASTVAHFTDGNPVSATPVAGSVTYLIINQAERKAYCPGKLTPGASISTLTDAELFSDAGAQELVDYSGPWRLMKVSPARYLEQSGYKTLTAGVYQTTPVGASRTVAYTDQPGRSNSFPRLETGQRTKWAGCVVPWINNPSPANGIGGYVLTLTNDDNLSFSGTNVGVLSGTPEPRLAFSPGPNTLITIQPGTVTGYNFANGVVPTGGIRSFVTSNTFRAYVPLDGFLTYSVTANGHNIQIHDGAGPSSSFTQYNGGAESFGTTVLPAVLVTLQGGVIYGSSKRFRFATV